MKGQEDEDGQEVKWYRAQQSQLIEEEACLFNLKTNAWIVCHSEQVANREEEKDELESIYFVLEVVAVTDVVNKCAIVHTKLLNKHEHDKCQSTEKYCKQAIKYVF